MTQALYCWQAESTGSQYLRADRQLSMDQSSAGMEQTSPDGTYLLTADLGGTVYLWEVSSGSCPERNRRRHKENLADGRCRALRGSGFAPAPVPRFPSEGKRRGKSLLLSSYRLCFNPMQTYALIIRHKNIRDRQQGYVTKDKAMGRVEGNWDEWTDYLLPSINSFTSLPYPLDTGTSSVHPSSRSRYPCELPSTSVMR